MYNSSSHKVVANPGNFDVPKRMAWMDSGREKRIRAEAATLYFLPFWKILNANDDFAGVLLPSQVLQGTDCLRVLKLHDE
jgi:hypothetical protein